MKILKVIALFLHYPDGTAGKYTEELLALVHDERLLTTATRQALENFIEEQLRADLLELQADYVTLFDRGRALSLHLFEHVHGESRDRGQAMVELLAVYRKQGLSISANELPDYVPLFLEFCSLLPETESRKWLHQVEHLLQTLHGRLVARKSPYATLFKALLELGGLATADAQSLQKIESEQRDDTPLALDRVWAEEPVIFGPSGGCGGDLAQGGQAVPIHMSGLRPDRS